MQFLYAVLALATFAAAAPAASADAAASVQERQAASPCYSNQRLIWTTSGPGGWGCVTNGNGGCRAYYWKDSPPYFSCG